jgi:hypothetical protein
MPIESALDAQRYVCGRPLTRQHQGLVRCLCCHRSTGDHHNERDDMCRHCLTPPPTLRERRHRRLARRLVAVCVRAIFMMPKGERPHPRRADRRGVGLEDAADDGAIGRTSKSSSFHSPDGREAPARLRISKGTGLELVSTRLHRRTPKQRTIAFQSLCPGGGSGIMTSRSTSRRTISWSCGFHLSSAAAK